VARLAVPDVKMAPDVFREQTESPTAAIATAHDTAMKYGPHP